MGVLSLRPEGLYCPAGDFYVDPWGKVDRAVVTHAHSDHARWGSRQYLCAIPSVPLMETRLGTEMRIEGWEYGEERSIGSARVSLHPAGHIWGSAQVRIDVGGEVWVVSGDYKTQHDQTAQPWVPLNCHGFVTETTFGLPIYHWQEEKVAFRQINEWWSENAKLGRTSVLFAYSLGKAQRLIAGVDQSLGQIVVHGAVATMNRSCESAGLKLPRWHLVSEVERVQGSLVIAPPSAAGTPWMRRFGDVSTAFASGWMSVRGMRRRRNVDRGFVMSDHVDWPSLLSAVEATGAEEVWTTHGYADTVARYLVEEKQLRARPIETRFENEDETDA